jgi:hypothetical protein
MRTAAVSVPLKAKWLAMSDLFAEIVVASDRDAMGVISSRPAHFLRQGRDFMLRGLCV